MVELDRLLYINMNDNLIKIHQYVFDLMKFAEAKNIALLVFSAGTIGFIGKNWNSLFYGVDLAKSLLVMSIIVLFGCVLLLLLSLTTMFNSKLLRNASHEHKGDLLSIKEMANCTQQSLITGMFGKDSHMLHNELDLSLASKIIINSKSTETKLFVFEKCVLGTLIWIMLFSGSLFANLIS